MSPIEGRLRSDGRLGAELGRGKAGTLQAKGERHGEAPGVCCGDHLFGIGALLVLKAGLE